MLNRFRQHISSYGIHAGQPTPLLLAVSGGLDSTVMAHLFHRAGIPFALAHVHYGLRGEESLEDMIFVEALARTLHVPFHCSDASANMRNVLKAEIQQAARAWRYRVFGELCHEHGYRMLALAHHGDDQEEHFWMYRQRGNILSALSGMPDQRPLSTESKDVLLIRPLLFSNREELRSYAMAEGIHWREDRSNAEPGYLRNRLRLQQIPELKSANPEVYAHFTAMLEQRRPVFAALKQGLQRMDAYFVCSEEEQLILLNREAILHNQLGRFWLKQYLARFGFHADLAARIFASGFKNGLRFRGKTTWELYSHVEGWYLVPSITQDPPLLYLQPENSELRWCGHRLRIRMLSTTEANRLPRNRNIMHFDADGLDWPLMLRGTQPGDRIRKLSGGHVKIGDLCTDLKIPVFKRPQLPLLYSGAVLLGIPGLVRSGTHLITNQTAQVLVVEFEG